MTFKLATLQVPNSPAIFAFPQSFSEDAIKDALKAIKSGYPKKIKPLQYLDVPVIVDDYHKPLVWVDCKYIVQHDPAVKDSQRFMVLFPKRYSHALMFEMLQYIAYQTNKGTVRPFSAGLITNNICHDCSGTLNIDGHPIGGHPDDSKLLHQTFVEGNENVKE